jgi:excisionase family DNA binding protein
MDEHGCKRMAGDSFRVPQAEVEVPMKKLLSIEDAAELLGLSPWTVRMYIRKNLLGHVKIGRRVLVETEELDRFVRSWKCPLQEASIAEPASELVEGCVSPTVVQK